MTVLTFKEIKNGLINIVSAGKILIQNRDIGSMYSNQNHQIQAYTCSCKFQ